MFIINCKDESCSQLSMVFLEKVNVEFILFIVTSLVWNCCFFKRIRKRILFYRNVFLKTRYSNNVQRLIRLVFIIYI